MSDLVATIRERRVHPCGGESLGPLLARGEGPAAGVVTRSFGTRPLRAVAAERAGGASTEIASVPSTARGSISLPKPRESTAKNRGSERR
jgi:hypothetical protein